MKFFFLGVLQKMEHPLVVSIPPKAGIPFLGISPIFFMLYRTISTREKVPTGYHNPTK
jgi:hypothetical protein